MSHPTNRRQMSNRGSFRNTFQVGGRLTTANDGQRRGNKEDLIIIVNNTKTHRPTIILGNTLGIANLHRENEARGRPRARTKEGNLTWNKSYTLYVYFIVFFVLNR